MSVNKEDTLRQFCDVTGADEGRSRFFLESSNWQLEVALSSFYEHGGNTDEAPADPRPAPASLPTLSDSDMESPPGSPVRPQRKDKKKTSNTKFATLNTLQQDTSSDEEEARKRRRDKSNNFFCDTIYSASVTQKEPRPGTSKSIKSHDSTASSEDIEKLKLTIERLRNENNALKAEIEKLKEITDGESEAGQAFYAGGSERSGQQILGPSKGRKDIVTEMFKSVRERGAVVFEEEPSTTRGRGAFAGVGYRLGQAADDHEPVTPADAQQSPTAEGGRVRMVRLRLYREGFTVDDGPPREYSDPASAEFLAAIRRGEVPAELAAGSAEVRVSLEDRRCEPGPRASAPGPGSRAFAGKGHLLGSPTPTTVGATAPVAAAPSDREANQRAAQDALRVDDSQPVTTIQFRLADGSRITGRFNHTHTVEDLQRYVARAEPAYQLARFALLTTFPSAELSDPTLTLGQGKLLNTTLLQRLK